MSIYRARLRNTSNVLWIWRHYLSLHWVYNRMYSVSMLSSFYKDVLLSRAISVSNSIWYWYLVVLWTNCVICVDIFSSTHYRIHGPCSWPVNTAVNPWTWVSKMTTVFTAHVCGWRFWHPQTRAVNTDTYPHYPCSWPEFMACEHCREPVNVGI